MALLVMSLKSLGKVVLKSIPMIMGGSGLCLCLVSWMKLLIKCLA